MAFAGDSAAIATNGGQQPRMTTEGIKVYVSRLTNGSDKWRWSLRQNKLLATWIGYKNSMYRYVEFIPPSPPQTGDGARPWLWAGIALLCAVLAGAGLYVPRRRKRIHGTPI